MLNQLSNTSSDYVHNFLRSVLESTFHGIMAFASVRDQSGNIIDFEWKYSNDIACQIVQKTSDELMGACLLEVMPGNREAGLFDKYKQVVLSGQSISFEQYYPSEEIHRWFNITAVKQGDGFTVSFQDITPFKQVLKEAKARSVQYKKLFDESMDPIFVVDASFALLDANPAFQELFLPNPQSWQSSPLEQIFPSLDDFMNFTHTLGSQGKLVEREQTLINEKGKKRHCYINCVPFWDEEIQTTKYIGVIRDVSKRKQLNKQLLLAEKLSLTGKIARTIAHEVRNPLTNLILALQQLKDEVPAETAEDADMYFNIIQRNADRISNLITDLLNSSKPKELSLKPRKLQNVVRAALDLVKDRIKLQDMRLVTNFEPDVPAIPLDTDQMKVALTNLFINAIEAMKPELGVLSVSLFQDQDTFVIQIQDNGKGISPENLHNLFEPFFSAKVVGTGLGLTAVQNIILSHRGHIEVESQVGKGTSFYIRLPSKL